MFQKKLVNYSVTRRFGYSSIGSCVKKNKKKRNFSISSVSGICCFSLRFLMREHPRLERERERERSVAPLLLRRRAVRTHRTSLAALIRRLKISPSRRSMCAGTGFIMVLPVQRFTSKRPTCLPTTGVSGVHSLRYTCSLNYCAPLAAHTVSA